MQQQVREAAIEGKITPGVLGAAYTVRIPLAEEGDVSRAAEMKKREGTCV